MREREKGTGMLRRFLGENARPASSIDVATAYEHLTAGAAVMVDVREWPEWREGHVAGARLIPLGELAVRLEELPRDRELLLFCRSGHRSDTATRYLRELGYPLARNVEGGILAWLRQGLPVERDY